MSWIDKYAATNLDSFFANREVISNLQNLQNLKSPFNICIVGDHGTGKRSITKAFLNEFTKSSNVFYMNNASYKTFESKETVHEFLNFKNGGEKKFIVLENVTKYSTKFVQFLYVLLVDPNITVITLLSDTSNLTHFEKNSVIFETKDPTVDELFRFSKHILTSENISFAEEDELYRISTKSYTKFMFDLQTAFQFKFNFETYTEIPIDIDIILNHPDLNIRFFEIEKLLNNGFSSSDITERIYESLLDNDADINVVVEFGKNLVLKNSCVSHISLKKSISCVWMTQNPL